MAVHPIDGNKLIEWFSPYLHTGEPIPADVVIEDIRSMPTLTPPNEPLTLEQLRGMKKVTPVWWEGAGFWCLAQSGGIVTPFGQCYDVEGLPGEFYSYPPVHIGRESWDDCPICGKYKAISFRGYRTREEAVDLSGKIHPHVSGGARFCPRCGKPRTPEAWAELEKRLRG